MSFLISFFIVQIKRLMRHPSTILCLLAAPVLVLCVGLMSPPQVDNQIQVGFLLPQHSRHRQIIKQSLVAAGGKDIRFVEAESQTQLEDNVAVGKWECGYLFPDHLDEKLAKGKFKRLLIRVQGPGSSLGSIVDWTVAAAVLQASAPEMVNRVLEKNGVADTEELQQYRGLAEEIFSAGDPFSVEVMALQGREMPTATNPHATAASLARGLLALMLLLFSSLTAVWFARDVQTGFFSRIRPHYGTARLYVSSLAASGLLAALSGGICLVLSTLLFPLYFGSLLRGLVLLSLYLVSLAGFSFLLAMLFSRQELLVSILPFILVGCLVFCPIIIDVGSFVPGVALVSTLLPPTGFLRALAGTMSPIFIAVQGAGYFAAGLLMGRLQKKL